jgi:hypothetical protein
MRPGGADAAISDLLRKPKRKRPTAGTVSVEPKSLEAYYDPHGTRYWMRNARGGWVPVNETGIRRHLRAAGVSNHCNDDEVVSALDRTLIMLQQERDVDYAGPLAGYRTGMYEIQNRRVLVTESPVLIEPVKGEWPLLHTIIENMLVDGLCDQRPYFYGWLKVGIESLRQWQRRPGQALALCGPHDCGKSLLQLVITQLLGGRVAKPYQYMTGATPFNADLFGAEHQCIEDDPASTDIRARRNFGANLKNVTVNDLQRCHAKNRTPISLTPFWRLTVTVNDEPENLMVLPPIDDSIEDKLILLRAHKRPMPARTASLAERTAFWSALVAELPAFVDFLLQWEIPAELQSERFGITHYQHPVILRAVDDLAPEYRLLTLIDMEIFKVGNPSTWEGTAEELEKLLTDRDASTSYAARQLFTWNTAAGVYLGRLAKKCPLRFSERRLHGQRHWQIKSPAELVEGCEAVSHSKIISEETIKRDKDYETPLHPATSHGEVASETI